MRAAASARDEAGGGGLVGACVRYHAEALEGYDTPSAAVFYPRGAEHDQIHLGREDRVGATVRASLLHQLASVAREKIDFFVVEGCATADDVGRLGAILDEYPEVTVKKRRSDLRGFDHDAEEVTSGFGAPVLLVSDGGADTLGELARAAAAVPKIEGLAATSATPEQAAGLKELLGGKALAVASGAEGELVVC